jgi:FkbM family methyltransferase
MNVIVIPLHRRGGKFKDDTEARFAIRSICENFTDPFKIVILAAKLPAWATGIDLVHDGGQGLKTAIRRAALEFPNGFFWWYDDSVLLQPRSAAQLKITTANVRWIRSNTGWAKLLDQVRGRLVAENIPAKDFSRPHGPYWFDKGMIDEAFEDWPGMSGKFPFESWILNKRRWPSRSGGVRQYYGRFHLEPGPNDVILNYNDTGNTLPLRNWLRARFPKMSVHEATAAPSQVAERQSQWSHLHGVWQEFGAPALRTVCECAVGPNSHVACYKEFSERTLLVEPHPRFAREARANFPWAEVVEAAVGDAPGQTQLCCAKGASFTENVSWAPLHKVSRRKAARAPKTRVKMVTFDTIDDGRIDLINLDCEGSEWTVVKNLRSRPRFIQIELYPEHGHRAELERWFQDNDYQCVKRWGNANQILVRREKV